MFTMDEVKKNPVAGSQFLSPTGAVGTVLEGLSIKGKVRAEFNCVVEGCTATHVREQSDWHQCGKCLAHTKKRYKSTGTKKVVSNNETQALAELTTEFEETQARVAAAIETKNRVEQTVDQLTES